MADGGFAKGFLLIIKIFKWIVLFIWYTTLLILFLFSFIAFWRIPCIFHGLKGNCNISENGGFQTFLLNHLAIIIFDIFRFPFIIFCYISFTRTYIIHKYLFDNFSDNYFGAYDKSIKSRKHLPKSLWFFIKQFILNIIETFIVILSIPSIIIISRFIGFWNFLIKSTKKTFDDDNLNKLVPVWMLLLNYLYGIADLLAYFTGILSLFCLTRCPRLTRICLIFFKLICPENNTINHDQQNNEYNNDLLFDSYNHKYLITNLLFGLTDYFLILINIIISIIAWPRFFGLINALKYCSKDIANPNKEYPFLYKLLFRNFIWAIPEAIGLILFVLSLIFFTRWYHSIKSLTENYSKKQNNDNNRYQYNDKDPNIIFNLHTNIIPEMLLSILRGAIDYITLLITIFSIIMPTRFVPFFKIINKKMDIYWKDEYHLKLHGYLYCNLLLAISDILVLPLSMIGCLSPTRFVKAFNLWWNFLRCKCCGYKQPNWNKYWNGFEIVEYNIEFRLNAIKNSIFGVIDLFCLLIGFISFLCLPFNRLFDNLTNKKRKEKYYKIKEYHIWSCLAAINIIIAITDFFIFTPLFLIAFLTHPFCSIQSFKKFNINWDPKQPQNQQQQNQQNENLSEQFKKLIRYNCF